MNDSFLLWLMFWFLDQGAWIRFPKKLQFNYHLFKSVMFHLKHLYFSITIERDATIIDRLLYIKFQFSFCWVHLVIRGYKGIPSEFFSKLALQSSVLRFFWSKFWRLDLYFGELRPLPPQFAMVTAWYEHIVFAISFTKELALVLWS